MATIVTRSGKGSALTHTEMDANFNNLNNGKVESVASISDLVNASTSNNYNVLNYHSDVEGGGGVFYWDATKDKSEHNGGTIIDPTATFPTDWSVTTQQETWFNTNNAGVGCWVRQYDGAVDVKWFGAKGEGVTDDTKAIQKSSTFGHISSSQGTYRCTGTVEFSSNNITFEGNGAIFDFSDCINDREFFVTKETSLVALPSLSVSPSKFDRELIFSSTPDVAQGDVIVIYNPTDYSWSSLRDYYRAGERVKVALVNGTTVTTQSVLYDDYDSSIVEVYKHAELVTANFSNFTLLGGDSTSVHDGLVLKRCVDSFVENVIVKKASYTCITIGECFNTQVNGCTAEEDYENIATGEYGISIANSQNIDLIGGSFSSYRHGVTVGGASGIGKVVNYNINILNATVSTSGGLQAADFHENTAFSSYHNCMINGSMYVSGKNLSVTNNTIIQGNTGEGNDITLGLRCLNFNHTIASNKVYFNKVFDNANNEPQIRIDYSDLQEGGILNIVGNQIKSDMLLDNTNYAIIGSGSVDFGSSPDISCVLNIKNNSYKNLGTGYLGHFVYLRAGSDQTKKFKAVNIENNYSEKTLTAIYITHLNALDTSRIAEKVTVSNNTINNTKTTGCTIGYCDEVVFTNNSLTDYLQTATSSSSTNSAAYILRSTTVVEHSNFTNTTWTDAGGLTADRRVGFYIVENLFRGQKADLTGKVDTVSSVTNDIAM